VILNKRKCNLCGDRVEYQNSDELLWTKNYDLLRNKSYKGIEFSLNIPWEHLECSPYDFFICNSCLLKNEVFKSFVIEYLEKQIALDQEQARIIEKLKELKIWPQNI
jgi:hypothetical protein